ncbi:MAG: hypothetical protein KIS94_05575 [Chitinophagales bacterium]|nr:hypothetical protein [Chitinophagales bacterium]
MGVQIKPEITRILELLEAANTGIGDAINFGILGYRSLTFVPLPITTPAPGTNLIAFDSLADKVPVSIFGINSATTELLELPDLTNFTFTAASDEDIFLLTVAMGRDFWGLVAASYNVQFFLTGIGSSVSFDSGQIDKAYALIKSKGPVS